MNGDASLSWTVEINRRALLGTAAATAAMTIVPLGLAEAASKLEAVHGSASFLAWLRETRDGLIRVSLATIGPNGKAGSRWLTVGEENGIVLPMNGAAVSLQDFATRQDALAATRRLIANAAAERWHVAAATCAAERGYATHRSSDRKAAYRIWAEIA